MTYYAAGRRDEAAREWREVVAMQPANKFARLYLRLVVAGAAPARPTDAAEPRSVSD